MNAGNESVKVIDWLERLRNSANGNPRYRIHFTDGTVLATKPDADVSYGLGNPEVNRGVSVLVKTTPAGLVWDVAPVGEQHT